MKLTWKVSGKFSGIAAAATAGLLIAQQASAQYYPSYQIQPPPGKPYQVFQQDNAVCQQWANQSVAYAQQQAGNQVAGGAVAGAIGGALIGGLLGGGRGAAIGAGAGAVTGGATGAAQAQNTAYYAQQQFDGYYQQCMTQRGNPVQYQQPMPPVPPPGSAPEN